MSLVKRQRPRRCWGVAIARALCVRQNNITGVLINRNNCWGNNAACNAIRARSTTGLMTASPKRMGRNIYYQISARYWAIRVSPAIIQLSLHRRCISHLQYGDINLWMFTFIDRVAFVWFSRILLYICHPFISLSSLFINPFYRGVMSRKIQVVTSVKYKLWRQNKYCVFWNMLKHKSIWV